MKRKNRIQNEIEHFTKLPHVWWGAKTYTGQKRYDFKYQEFKKYCRPNPVLKILEIGCGDGEFTRRLAKLRCQIIATDLTPAVIKRANSLVKDKNINFKVANAEKMSFPSGYFDIVCGISILHHLNYPKALAEIFRVLKSGGQLFFTEPNLINPIIFAGLKIRLLREKMEFSPNETALTRSLTEKNLKKAGFKRYEVVNYDFIYPTLPRRLLAPAKKISSFLEKLPLLKEISGSLIIWAEK